MAHVLTKGGRYMTGHSYATGLGYRFSWSPNEADAIRFSDTDSSVICFCNMTGARCAHRPNTRAELRTIGRERIRWGQKPSVHPSDAKINRRAALAINSRVRA